VGEPDAQAGEARSVCEKARTDALELGYRVVELALQADATGGQGCDLVLESTDALGERGDVGGQDALASVAALDGVSGLVDLLAKLARVRSGIGCQRQGRPQGDSCGGEKDNQEVSAHRSGAMLNVRPGQLCNISYNT
jgi:hypothetical protein